MTCRAPTGSQTCSGTPTGQALTYDPEGRTTAWQNAQTNPTSTEQMAYDGEGSRVALVVNGGAPTYYVGDLEEVTGTGGSITKYLSAAGLPIAERVGTGGPLSYLAADGLGSVSEALDGSSNASFQQLFTPYGTSRYSSGTSPTTKAFTGQRADSASGLDYYGARYYDPTAGQFASADTVADGLNAYAYVHDNPATLADPSGHWGGFGSFFSAVGSAAHAVAGAVVSAAPTIVSVAVTVLDVTTGIPSMWHDIQTIADPHKSLAEKLLAGGDLALNAFMDATMLVGLGEGMRAGYVAAKVASKVGEQVARHVGQHVAEDVLGHATEHVAEDVVTHAGEDTVEHGGQHALEQAGKVCSRLSFAPDTLVATPSGEQAIGSLQVGDQVTAYDPSSRQTSAQTVEHVWINHDSDLMDVTLAAGDAQQQAQQGNGTNGKVQEVAVASHGLRAPPTDGHESSDASGLSSSETIHTTAKHPWLTADRGWEPAGQLAIGERVVRADGTAATIVTPHVRPGAADYYNLTVSQLHTYAVGAGQYVVHNCKPVKAGDAGAYKDLLGTKGDDLTPHHMPGQSLANHFGFDPDKGGTIVMDQATHAKTFNYAGKANEVKSATIQAKLTFRQSLAQHIRDYRKLVPNSNQSVRNLLAYWRSYKPGLMAK